MLSIIYYYVLFTSQPTIFTNIHHLPHIISSHNGLTHCSISVYRLLLFWWLNLKPTPLHSHIIPYQGNLFIIQWIAIRRSTVWFCAWWSHGGLFQVKTPTQRETIMLPHCANPFSFQDVTCRQWRLCHSDPVRGGCLYALDWWF